MSLEAQIALLDSPVDFMRLCNACLAAEYGDDFLAIADDRADRGNDGFLQSEGRLFAAHCFRRVQNQSVEREIKRKAASDLSKAVQLKQEGKWDVRAWTFLCNYPIPESIASTLYEFGAAADIEVGWRGPEYLARILTENNHLAEQFPALFVPQVHRALTELQGSIAQIQSDGGDTATSIAVLADDRIPRSDGETALLLSQKPAGWEYTLFAGSLIQGRDRLKRKWEDHVRGLTREKFKRLDWNDATDFLSSKSGELVALAGSTESIFDRSAQERAFGAPGFPGDAELIVHLADWTVSIYEQMLDWAADVRATELPDDLEKVRQSTVRLVDRPLHLWRDFANRCENSISRVVAHLESGSEEWLELELVLTMEIEPGLTRQISREMKKAGRKAPWF